MPHLIVMTYSAPPFCSAKRFRKGSGPEAIAARWGDHRSTGQRGPLASIPLTLQIGGLAVVVLGTPRHALDAFPELAQAKVPVATMATLRERPLAQTQFAQAEGLLRAGRSYFYQCNDEVWCKGCAIIRLPRLKRGQCSEEQIIAI